MTTWLVSCCRGIRRAIKMGASATKIQNEDRADGDVDLGVGTWSRNALLERCRREVGSLLAPQLRRSFMGTPTRGPDSIRVLQWNLLSQALAEKADRFVCCPDAALNWYCRRWRILEDIVLYEPDIMCLQEVDHYNFLRSTLGRIGFAGVFFPKPDSPCCYVKDNNGPDGCAFFYDQDKFELISCEKRVLQVFTCPSNQVTLLCILRRKSDGAQLCVVTTHLKARQGMLLTSLRHEQGKDLMKFVRTHRGGRPTIITGDLNAEPWEPVYKTLLGQKDLGLESSYAVDEQEPPYTTWKIREEGEVKHTIDYIFFSRRDFTLEARLQLPSEGDIGPGRVPSLAYPSDHFSLVVDLRLPLQQNFPS
ncbi:nocturnin-like isoform X2 [Ornithodoros turicata]|uniref:nocturnin-like isoform X2 n=1 Tax=Ornithodoros turicata TaxID=34597 RepID=UPI00313A3353